MLMSHRFSKHFRLHRPVISLHWPLEHLPNSQGETSLHAGHSNSSWSVQRSTQPPTITPISLVIDGSHFWSLKAEFFSQLLKIPKKYDFVHKRNLRDWVFGTSEFILYEKSQRWPLISIRYFSHKFILSRASFWYIICLYLKLLYIFFCNLRRHFVCHSWIIKKWAPSVHEVDC